MVWITERKDVLCGLFFLGAVLAYLKAVESGTLDRRWQVVSLASFAAALLAKAAAMPLPAILFLLDVYPLRRARGAPAWRRMPRREDPVGHSRGRRRGGGAPRRVLGHRPSPTMPATAWARGSR